ncbi:MAG: tyrosine-type recombinase/integrase [Bdellovibrionales bacterium]
MATINFTVRGLSAIAAPQDGRAEYWDATTKGFGLRVSSTGARSWIVLYRAGGRKRRYTIGDYDRLPLADARMAAKEILYQVASGKDPGAEKSLARKAETFGEIAELYIDGWAIPRKRSWEQDQKLLNWYVLPSWANLKARDIRRADVKALLNRQVKRGAPVVANRVLSLVRKVFNYALEEDIGQLEFNPCQAIKPPGKESAGQRVLTFEEIRKLWKALDDSPDKEAAAIIRLRLLTLQRGGEIRQMRWCELDYETGWWTIPGSRTKNKLDHRVPLTEQIIAVISEFEGNRRRSEFVFPSPLDATRAIQNVKDPFNEIRAASGVKHFVMRDLRRTGTSYMTGRLGITRIHVAKVLNHKELGITHVYDRHSYDPEKQRLMSAWNSLILEMVFSDRSRIANMV